MMQLVFNIKNFISDRLILLKASIVYTFQNETAYWSNNIASALSTTSYNIAYIIFLNVLFANTKSIAGYSYNDILLFYFITEVSAYLNGFLNLDNLDELIRSVNSGDLDLVLSKPVPSLFYVSFKNLNVVALIRDGLPPLLILVNLIHWDQFQFNILNVLTAICTFVLGIIASQSFLLIACLPVFWLGESKSVLGFANELWFSSGTISPFEGAKSIFKNFTIVLLPALLTTAITTSILLNKVDPIAFLTIGLLITFIFLVLKMFLWKVALRNYTSASS